jgi:hypothetical protein
VSERRGPGLRLHCRTQMVALARAEFHVIVAQFLADHDNLTDIELTQIMLLAPEIPLKYALRAERHPDDPGKKADEE